MKVIVADDEIPAREELIYLLKRKPEIEVIGEAATGEETLNKAITLRPDVLFLDIKMPDASGVEVARKIVDANIDTAIVFATAYDDYAINAFEVNAVDYILKPFDEKRLSETVNRLIKHFSNREEIKASQKYKELPKDMFDKLDEIYSILHQTNIKKIKAEENEQIYLISVQDIVFATIDGRKVRIFTSKDNYLANYTLNELEKTVGSDFLRVHKSFLANVNKIDVVIPWFNNMYNIVMSGGHKVPVSRTYVKAFREKLKI